MLVLLVAAGLVALTPADPERADPPTSSTGEPVASTVLACPRGPSLPEGVRTSYAVASVASSGLGEDGDVVGAEGLARGAVRTLSGSTPEAPVLEGTLGLAQGLMAWRQDTGASTAVTTCPSPRASWWFTGLGASLDHDSTLTIANVDSGPAVVDLRVLSPEGELDLSETGGTGITIPPGRHRSFSLVELAPQNDELAIQVRAARGRVVAAVSDRYAETPTAPSALEWVPAQDEPARVVRLSGVPPRARSRTVLVANPSSSEAVVSVELAGSTGRLRPAGLEDLTLAPGELTTVPLPRQPAEAVAVRVLADHPVVAVLRSVVPVARGATDLVYAGAAEPLTGPAALPVLGTTSLQVSAGAETTRATASAYSAQGELLADNRFSLAASSTGAWSVPARAAYVVVEPIQGSAYGAVVYSGAAAQPLRELPVSIRVPAVRPAG